MYDRLVKVIPFAFALVCGGAAFVLPLQYGRIGWIFAFSGWWLVGIGMMAVDGLRKQLDKKEPTND